MQKITTCLWFDNNAEEAVTFYISLFKNSNVLEVSRYGEAGPGPAGSVLTIRFQLDGVELIALNGGPMFKFSEATSLSVDCLTQTEIDQLWDSLSEGGEIQQCGWLRDRYGLSWQIVPTVLGQLMSDPDPAKSNRVMEAVLKMVKLDIKTLQEAYAG